MKTSLSEGPPEECVNQPLSDFTIVSSVSSVRDNRSHGRSKTKGSSEGPFDKWTLRLAFLEYGMAQLTGADAKVWEILHLHASEEDGKTIVPRSRLVKTTGNDKRTIRVSIQRLIKTGWLERIQRGGPKKGVAQYRVKLPEGGG